MSNRNLLILGLAAVLTVSLAVVQSRLSSGPQAKSTAGAGYLIQGLDPDQIASITIGMGDERIIFNRKGAGFVVASKDNYPALTSEINKLITTCLDIRTAELYTDNPANFKDLDVTEPNARVFIKFFKPDSTLLTGVIIGKQKERTQGICYVRRVEDNKVYLTAAQIPWIKRRAIEYAEQGLTSVKREDINSVTVSGPPVESEGFPGLSPGNSKGISQGNGIYVLRSAGDGNTIALDNIPEGKTLKNDAANTIFNALSDVKFDDVNAADSLKNLKFDRRFDCRLKNSTVYTFRLAKQGDTWFARCDAVFMDITPVTKTKGEVESQEELKKKEAKLLARDAAEEFSENHKGWVYQIPANEAGNMTKPLADLLEDEVKQSEPNAVK